jgi:hypothetical protein
MPAAERLLSARDRTPVSLTRLTLPASPGASASPAGPQQEAPAAAAETKKRERAAAARQRTNAAADAAMAAVVEERDPNRRLELVQELLRPVRRARLDFYIRLADTDPEPAIRRAVIERLGRVRNAVVTELFERRAEADPDAGVAMLALESLRSQQAARLGQIYRKRLERARSANDAAGLKALIPESQFWISYSQGAVLPRSLQEAPPVFEAVPAGKPLRAVVIGDYGAGTPAMTQTAAAALAYHRRSPFHIGLTLGDNLPPDGAAGISDPRWKNEWEDLYGPMKIPFFASTGNHDWHLGESPAAEILYTHRSGTWRMPALFYSFTAGPVQFFALGTQTMSDAQLKWLDEELGRSKARWKIVYGHHPIYSEGSHGDTDGFDTTLLPLLKGRAQAYIAGHDHMAQHLKPEGGVHFFVNAAGGQTMRKARSSERTLYAGAFYGFMVIEAAADELTVRFVDLDGEAQYQTRLK